LLRAGFGAGSLLLRGERGRRCTRELVYHCLRGLSVNVEEAPSSTIDLLFGKPIERLSCSDVRVLVEAGASESPRLEFKEGAAGEEELVKLILKSVVGFLNSDVGKRVLILDVRGREHAEKLVCVPHELLGESRDVVESRVRNWVFNYLASIPPMIVAPRLLVKVFDCRDCGLEGQEGWVILIYVKKSFDALYYSKADNTAYQRRGNEIRRLTLEEAIHVANAKRQPIILVFMEPMVIEENMVKLDILACNIGSAPANVGVSLVKVYKKAKILPSLLETDLSISMHNVSKLAEDQEAATFQVNIGTPLTLPLFPRIYAKIGEIGVSFKETPPKGAKLAVLFNVVTYTELNRAIQTCLLILGSSTDYTQACLASAGDYMGNTIFETQAKEGEVVVCDKKDIRVENLLKMLATIFPWDMQPKPL